MQKPSLFANKVYVPVPVPVPESLPDCEPEPEPVPGTFVTNHPLAA